MAQGPLTVQRPLVSLIGGSQLQKASGAGVQAPDFGGAVRELTTDLQRKQAQNRALIDSVEGTAYAEMETRDPMAAGKDASGNWVKLPPLPKGSPQFQAAYFETRAQNAAAGMRTSLSTQLNEIQQRYDLPIQERSKQMDAAVNGRTETLDPAIAPLFRRESSAELESRNKQMAAEDADRRYRADLSSLDSRVEEGGKEAIAAGLAGGDYQPALDRTLQAMDEKARLIGMHDDELLSKKTNLINYVGAAKMQGEMSTEIIAGNADLAQADAMALSLKSGGTGPETELVVDRDFEPTNFNVERERAGQTEVYKRFSSRELQQKFGDADVTMQMGQRLQEVIDAKRREMTQYEKINGYWEEVKRVTGTDVELSKAMEGEHETVFNAWITSGAIEQAPVMNEAVKLITATKKIPPSFVSYMENKLLGGNVDAAIGVSQLWNQLSTTTRGASNVGEMIRNSVPAEKRLRFDNTAAALATMVVDGKPPSQDQWKRYVEATNNPKNSVDEVIKQFNTGKDAEAAGFHAQVRTRFRSDYGDFYMPPDMMTQVETAFQVAYTSGTNPTIDAALEQAWTETKKNWQQSGAFYGQVQPTDNAMKNPPGWTTERIRGFETSAAGTEWLNDHTVNSLGLMDDNNQIVFSPGEAGIEERAAFDAIMDNPDTALGAADGQMTLKATSSNRRYTQYNIIMRTQQGDEVMLMTRDRLGNRMPIVFDLELINAHLWSKAQAQENIGKIESDVDRKLGSIFYEAYSDVYGKATQMAPPYPTDWTNEERDEFITKYRPDMSETWKHNREEATKQLQKSIARENASVVQVPEGTPVDPKMLRTRKMAGLDVTIAAIQQLEQIGLSTPTESQYLLNVAAMESNFGQHPQTFRPQGDRGIWQINDGPMGAYKDVVARAGIRGDPVWKINEKLKTIGVDLSTINASDLESPIISAAVARVFMTTDPEQITDDLEQQGNLWKRKYNSKLGDGLVWGTAEQPGWMEVAGKVKMPTSSLMSPEPTPLYKNDPSGPGAVLDVVTGKPNPPHFRSMRPQAQSKAMQLSRAFGKPLLITPHGGASDRENEASQHNYGTAIDVNVESYTDDEKRRLILLAIDLGFKGIGGYGPGSPSGYGTLHFDIRNRGGNGPGSLAVWWWHTKGGKGPGGDDWSRSPSWFKESVNTGSAAIEARQRRNG